MTEHDTTGPDTGVDTPPSHDHAWRRVAKTSERPGLGEYRCDLCPAEWSL